MKRPIKDFWNRIIGYVEDDRTGFKTYRDFYNVIVGYYDPKRDVTLDFYRRIVGRGDIGPSLVVQAEAENRAKTEKKK